MLSIIPIWLLYGYHTSPMKRFNFTKFASQTSDQHYDLLKFSTARDHKNFTTIFKCLKLHSPFSYSAIDGLVSISTVIIAEKSANVDKTFKIRKDNCDIHEQCNFCKLSFEARNLMWTQPCFCLWVTCIVNEQSEIWQTIYNTSSVSTLLLYLPGDWWETPPRVLSRSFSSNQSHHSLLQQWMHTTF